MDEFSYYGKNLNGTETGLEKAQFARIKYLKDKMRRQMLPNLGDTDDNIADLTRAIALGLAIQNGSVTDEDIISRYNIYLNDTLASYGGADAIITILEDDKEHIANYVVSGYYVAKQEVLACESIEDVNKIDLHWEPSTEEDI